MKLLLQKKMYKTADKKWKKVLLWFVVAFAVLLLLITIVASPLAKRLIERNDITFTGREITIGRVFINPLAGSVNLRNFRIFEPESDTVFLFADKFSANLSLLKLFSGVYEMTSVTITGPDIRVFQDDSVFNFTDLVERFTVEKDTLADELRLNIKNIKIKNGIVRYSLADIPANFTISEISFSSPGMFWDSDSITGEFSLVPVRGNLSGDFMLNTGNLDYRMNMDLKDFDFSIFREYLAELASGKGNLRAFMDMNISSGGNFNEPMNGRASGRVDISDMHFGPDSLNDYLRFERFIVNFDEIDLKNNKFYFDSILIVKPFLLYQLFDTLDNYRRMLRSAFTEEVEEEVDTVDYLVDLINSDYYFNSIALTNGFIEFNDYSTAEKFSFICDRFNIKADSIDKKNKRFNVDFDGRMQPEGNFMASLSMDPKNEKYFDFNYEFRNIPATIFNPYIVSFTSYQLDRGTIEMHGKWSVRDNIINSLNHFLVIDPRDTKRVRGKDTKWVPLPLIMSFVRERGSVIDYEIPIKGDLKDPKFKLRDVISDLIRNILVKPPTTPYRLQVRNLKKEIEKSLRVTWKMRQVSIGENQDKFLEDIADFLEANPEAYLVVRPVLYVEKEKENILLFEAKKKYFFESGKKLVTALSEDDSMKVEKLSSKDSTFIRFMNSRIKNPGFLTLQEKCYRYVGKEIVDKNFEALVEGRKKAFMQFFVRNNTDKRVELLEAKDEIPYNWFSYFDINYRGDVPESISEAFNKLYEINRDPPAGDFLDFLRK